MAAGRSIFEYVKEKCYNGLCEAAEQYIEDNWPLMGLRSARVPRIDSVEFVDARVERVYVRNLPGDRIAFEVGLELELALYASDRHNDSEDECFPWIRVFCEGDLSCGLDDWEIRKIEPYNKAKAPPNSLSGALVPFIPYKDLETVADNFLKEYYPEALEIPGIGQSPKYIDPNKLASRLGLQVLTHRIREDASVFGQIFFDATDTEMFNPESQKTETVHVDAQTIVVDPENFLLRNLGSLNNTIVHECVHWGIHRKVFLLEKLYNDQASSISCEVVGGARSEIARQATEQMERQANQLAPRIQMPAKPFKAKAKEYITKFMREHGAAHEIDVMEDVIVALSTDFVVSRQAAKIRMVELGFEKAVGTFTYVDDHYVQPHSFKKGAIKRNQTFTIPVQDAAIQRFVNPELRKLTENGDYLFIDNHYVYYAPLYVEYGENGQLQLTGYARSHMDECCLVFDLTITGGAGSDYHTVCYLNRENSDVTFELNHHRLKAGGL